MPRVTPKSTKPSSAVAAAKHVTSNAYETYTPISVHVGLPLNPMLKYDFLQRRLVFNTDALKFLKSNKIRVVANRALCTFRVVPVHGVDTSAILLTQQGAVSDHDVLPLMQWMRMDTNNRSLIGAIPMVPSGSYMLEGSYVELVTRRAATIAGEVASDADMGVGCAAGSV